MDEKNKLVIPCTFDFTGDFREGIVRVKKKEMFGFIDHTGKQVIPFDYEGAEDFFSGCAITVMYGKKGLIDRAGQMLIPFSMDEIIPVSSSILRLEKNKKISYYNMRLQQFIWKEEGFD
jgi:hypothetical protein